jgi:NAD(P)H-hydrate repair Nnr-like enzyme with NAD(P)H-hydrate dehydratase domain
MASAGMGDVLSGLIGSLIVQGSHYNLDPWKATCLAVQLHSLVAEILVNESLLIN